MEAQFASLPTWLDVVDFAALAPESKEGRVAFVDIGGGVGQQCKLLKEKVPDAQEIVLQDKKQVLDMSDVSFTKMEYDYLTEQPVKGELPSLTISFYHCGMMADWLTEIRRPSVLFPADFAQQRRRDVHPHLEGADTGVGKG